MYASDPEMSDNVNTGDMSGVTTDDELFAELMNAPAEFEDRLIPDQCKNEIEGLEHLTKCFNHRFNAYPVVFMGTLKDAVKESFTQKEINDRRPFLIYVNNDKSVATNLFCKQLLCHEKIIDYLMNNYVLWAWDITFESNERKLNEMCKNVFPPWTPDKQFNTNSIDQYPLLLGVYRNTNGDYCLKRLIEGFNRKVDRDEFLANLIQFKNEFEQCEQQWETAKEEAKKQMLLSFFQERDLHRHSRSRHDREFLRAMSMFPHDNYDDIVRARHGQYPRSLSGLTNVHPNRDEFLAQQFSSHDALMHTFERLHPNWKDEDDADDEDDDDGRTPTAVPRSPPKFPTQN